MHRLFAFATGISMLLGGLCGRAAQAEAVSFQQTHHRSLVPSNDRFPGSYYVENGEHFYQSPATSSDNGPAKITRGKGQYAADLTDRLEYEAKKLCLDLDDNYGHNRGFRETYQNAYQMWQLAREMNAARAADDHRALGLKARELDPLFQPVRREVSGWSRRHERQRGIGEVHDKVARIELLIDHLLYDLAPPARPPRIASGDGWRPLSQTASYEDAAPQETPRVASHPQLLPPQNLTK